MANLGRKNGIYTARFRYLGKEYKKSLKTADRDDANAALLEVQRAIHRLTVGILQVPEGVDPGDFILSGGTLATNHSRPKVGPTLDELAKEFQGNLAHLAASNRYTIGVHLRNLAKKLGKKAQSTVDRLERRDLEAFLQARLKERSHTTVGKERATIVQLFKWAVAQGHLVVSPATDLTRLKTGGDALPFRTSEEIEAIVVRGGLDREEAWDLWGCLYLTPAEISALLAFVRDRKGIGISFLLHALPAYTGMRRGELLRLRWSDVETDWVGLIARSKKQSRQAVELKRRIDLHPELKAILIEWQRKRPRGQYVLSGGDDIGPLTPAEPNRLFRQPLRGTEWCLSSRRNRFKLGFHTYRHSFASNLAAAGVDQRVIDEFMGHTTEAMRKRYRHLFPRDRRSAIESFSLAVSSSRPE